MKMMQPNVSSHENQLQHLSEPSIFMLDVFRTADHAGQIFIPHWLEAKPHFSGRLSTNRGKRPAKSAAWGSNLKQPTMFISWLNAACFYFKKKPHSCACQVPTKTRFPY